MLQLLMLAGGNARERNQKLSKLVELLSGTNVEGCDERETKHKRERETMRELKRVRNWVRSFEFWSNAAKGDLQHNDFAEYRQSQDRALFALVDAMESAGDLNEIAAEDAYRWIRGECRINKLSLSSLQEIAAEYFPEIPSNCRDFDVLKKTVDNLSSS